MKTNEFKKKLIEMGYQYEDGEGFLVITHDDYGIARIDNHDINNFDLLVTSEELKQYLYYLSLYKLIVKFSGTPIKDRIDHNKYSVIIGNDHSSFDPLILWEKGYDDKEPFVLNIGNMQSISDQAIFNDYEYDRLIKYIKTLPDGEWQAKVAEHDKTLVKGGE